MMLEGIYPLAIAAIESARDDLFSLLRIMRTCYARSRFWKRTSAMSKAIAEYKPA